MVRISISKSATRKTWTLLLRGNWSWRHGRIGRRGGAREDLLSLAAAEIEQVFDCDITDEEEDTEGEEKKNTVKVAHERKEKHHGEIQFEEMDSGKCSVPKSCWTSQLTNAYVAYRLDNRRKRGGSSVGVCNQQGPVPIGMPRTRLREGRARGSWAQGSRRSPPRKTPWPIWHQNSRR